MSLSVVGALHSPAAVAVATSVLGRKGLQVAAKDDVIRSVDSEGACALLLELGHPAFDQLCTRLSILGTPLPLVLVLPPGPIPATELLALSRIAPFSLAYDHHELPRVLRRTMTTKTASSDAQVVGRILDGQLPQQAAVMTLGLYVAGARNVTVAEACARLGVPGALRNRLRGLGLARASTILGWACAAAVVWRMEHESSSLAVVARALGFATTRQCSDRVLYHTGRTPTALREQFGFGALADEFVRMAATRVYSVA